jgi:hypothetical protein
LSNAHNQPLQMHHPASHREALDYRPLDYRPHLMFRALIQAADQPGLVTQASPMRNELNDNSGKS